MTSEELSARLMVAASHSAHLHQGRESILEMPLITCLLLTSFRNVTEVVTALGPTHDHPNRRSFAIGKTAAHTSIALVASSVAGVIK